MPLAALVFLVLPLGPAVAGSGDAVLEKMDAAMNRATDQWFDYEVVHQDPGKAVKGMRLQVQLKGQMRFTEFLAPADMKGTKVLSRNRTQMYIFLPAYNKVRRLASHMTEGGFLGTTFSNEDISIITYGDAYEAELQSEDSSSWLLSASPREGAKAAYGKLEITVGKKLTLPTQFKYFNKRGEHIKTETRTEYSCQGDVCNAKVMEMVDHSSGGASTKLIRSDWKVNTGISDSAFSVRNLQK